MKAKLKVKVLFSTTYYATVIGLFNILACTTSFFPGGDSDLFGGGTVNNISRGALSAGADTADS